MSQGTQHFHDFGDFRIDADERVLLRNGRPVPLTPKAFHLLKILVENHGHVVDKEKLMSEIWADSFVEEGNLAFNARALRKALDDDAHSPRFIETVPRRGYRFIAEVRSGISPAKRPSMHPYGESPGQASFDRQGRAGGRRGGAIVALADWRRDESGYAKDKTIDDRTNERTQEPTARSDPAAVSPLGIARKKRSFVVPGLTLLAVVSAVAFAISFVMNATKGTPSFLMQKAARLASNGKAKFATISPDSKFAAYVLDHGSGQSIRLKNIATGSDAEVLPPEPTTLGSLTFSPDGNYLYYGTNQKLYQLPVLGGTPKKVLEPYSGLQHNTISFSPDGGRFVFVRNSQPKGTANSAIIIADRQTGDERILTEGSHIGAMLRSAAWSPDGKTVACAVERPDGKYQAIFVSSDGDVLSPSAAYWNRVDQVVWRPDGSGLIAIASDRDHVGRVWQVAYPGGEAERLSEDSYNYQSISLAADGQTMVAARAAQESHIWLMPADDTTQAKQLTDGFRKNDGVFSIGWQGNDKIVYEAIPDDDGELWTIDTVGGRSKKVTSGVSRTAASPDGDHLVFTGEDNDGPGLFRSDDGKRARLTSGKDIWATFSPDGKWIVFNRFGEDVAVWKVPSEGGEAIKLTNCSCLPVSPTVSPDGKLIAFYKGKSPAMTHPQIAIIPFEGGEILKAFNMPLGSYEVFEGEATVQWTPDGGAINYVVHTDGVSNIWRQPIDGGEPFQLTRFPTELIFNFAFSPDGKQLALSRGTVSRDVILIRSSE